MIHIIYLSFLLKQHVCDCLGVSYPMVIWDGRRDFGCFCFDVKLHCEAAVF